MRQSSRKETTQPIQSNELVWRKLRRIGYDETAVSTGATSLRGHSQMSTRSVRFGEERQKVAYA